MNIEGTFLSHFKQLEDPRLISHRNLRHNLEDILIISILATICGADNWVEIERFGLAKQEWLETFLGLPEGIPSHDTFSRVFALLEPDCFETCFNEWIASLDIDLKNEIIALDGKTLRGSGNKRQHHPALHLVSAWATKNRVLLAQVKTEEKSNEISAIPKLLTMMHIEGATITLDAMGCQTQIAKQIITQGANYVLSLKENQPTLYHDVRTIFLRAEEEEKKYKKMLHLRRVEKIHAHGRIETRRYTLISSRAPLLFELRWPGLKGIGKVDVVRTTNNQVERSTRYFITSLDYEQIDLFKEAVRKHWHIEIDLHWSLDVGFREDLNQAHVGHSAHNLAIIRRIALNLLKKESSHKNGVACRRKTAGWYHAYLLKILTS
ncbi:ISAs1 family transposase [Legionella bozemanae]|nr:ISAs1 family transposase [Legionella bozemanae]STO33078.1 Transposase [Legionella bozemanae]